MNGVPGPFAVSGVHGCAASGRAPPAPPPERGGAGAGTFGRSGGPVRYAVL